MSYINLKGLSVQLILGWLSCGLMPRHPACVCTQRNQQSNTQCSSLGQGDDEVEIITSHQEALSTDNAYSIKQL